MHKTNGKKMEGLGKHHSTTQDKRLVGHSLVTGLYVLLGRSCPLAPQMYRQQSMCVEEDVPFSEQDRPDGDVHPQIRASGGNYEACAARQLVLRQMPVGATRERGFLITTGLKSNRALRVTDETADQGWYWEKLSHYLARLAEHDQVQMKWLRGDKTVFVHVVSTSIRKLYRSQVIIVRLSLDAPLAQARYWASSDLDANVDILLAHITARWDIEDLFGDKEELGVDQYQLMNATAILRFWTLARLSYVFLEEEQARLQTEWQRPVTIGEARREIQRRIDAMSLLGFMNYSNLGSNPTPCMSLSLLEAAQPNCAKIEIPSKEIKVLMKLEVLIAEHRDILRVGLRTIFAQDNRVAHVHEVSTEKDLYIRLRSFSPDLIVVNQTFITSISEFPQGRFIVLTAEPDMTIFQMAYEYGARGYLLEEVSAELLCATLSMEEGQFFIEPSMSANIIEYLSHNSNFSIEDKLLTPREQEIASLLREGVDRPTVAKKLNISEATLKTHIKNIARKRTRELERVRNLISKPTSEA